VSLATYVSKVNPLEADDVRCERRLTHSEYQQFGHAHVSRTLTQNNNTIFIVKLV
jgi:hypothetical protein